MCPDLPGLIIRTEVSNSGNSLSIEYPPLCRSLEQGARQPGPCVTREASHPATPPPRPSGPPGAPGRHRRAAPAAAHRGRPPSGGPPARRRRGRPAPLRAGPAPAGAAGGRPAEPVRAAEAALPLAVRALSIRCVLKMLCQLHMNHMPSSHLCILVIKSTKSTILVAGALGFPRYGSSPTPFGGLGSLRDSPLNPADPFGALAPRPGFPPSTSAGVWPLKVRMPEQKQLFHIFFLYRVTNHPIDKV